MRALARDAGLIFSGTVERIERITPAARGDIGVLRVTFRVGEALRGAAPGETVTISEWDGLWVSRDRYRLGERLLLFLYPPSPGLGLTTTVGGDQGRIALNDSGLSIAEVARQLGETRSRPTASERQPTRKPRPDSGSAE